jgi:hypothetical protein
MRIKDKQCDRPQPDALRRSWHPANFNDLAIDTRFKALLFVATLRICRPLHLKQHG